MEKSYNLTKLLLPYAKERLWVALSPDKKRVVGKGKNLTEALEEAKKNNVEKPTFIQAIPDYSGFAPLDK